MLFTFTSSFNPLDKYGQVAMVERRSHTIASDHLRLLGAAQNTLATPAAPAAAACIHSNNLSSCHYVHNGQEAPKCHLSVTSGSSGSWSCGQYKAILSITVNAYTLLDVLVSVSLSDRVWCECSEYGSYRLICFILLCELILLSMDPWCQFFIAGGVQLVA